MGTGHMPDPLGTGESPGAMCRRASYVRSIGFLFFSRGTLILDSYAVFFLFFFFFPMIGRLCCNPAIGFPS